jgi:hypothetical protein
MYRNMSRLDVIPFWLYVGLWNMALLLPLGTHAVFPLAGVAVGITVSILWVTQMPTSCLGSDFIAFPMAVTQIVSGIGWLVYGISAVL